MAKGYLLVKAKSEKEHTAIVEINKLEGTNAKILFGDFDAIVEVEIDDKEIDEIDRKISEERLPDDEFKAMKRALKNKMKPHLAGWKKKLEKLDSVVRVKPLSQFN